MQNQEIELNSKNTEYLLCLALDIGEGMLKNGAEVSRVEDTIERICKAYGAVHVEVFSIISYIHAALRMPDGSLFIYDVTNKNSAERAGRPFDTKDTLSPTGTVSINSIPQNSEKSTENAIMCY